MHGFLRSLALAACPNMTQYRKRSINLLFSFPSPYVNVSVHRMTDRLLQCRSRASIPLQDQSSSATMHFLTSWWKDPHARDSGSRSETLRNRETSGTPSFTDPSQENFLIQRVRMGTRIMRRSSFHKWQSLLQEKTADSSPTKGSLREFIVMQ